MSYVICVANQKGGVGKTTTTVNLAAALSQIGRRVLILDLDPQGNASSGLGIKKYENQDKNIYHVLVGQKLVSQVIQPTQVNNLKIATANPDLVGAEIELVDMPSREYRLRDAVKEVGADFDFILIDCPPSLGLLTVNALCAANSFLVPLQCEYYALEGLSQLLNTAGLIKKNLNPNLKIEGIVLTMFDARNNLSHQVVSEIQNHFGEKVFSAIIPRNVRLSEAPSHGQSIFSYDPKSVGAKKYLELAIEVNERVFPTTEASAQVNTAEVDTVEAEVETAPAPAQKPMPAPTPAVSPTKVSAAIEDKVVAAVSEAVKKSAEPPAIVVNASTPVRETAELSIDDMTDEELEALTAPTKEIELELEEGARHV